VVHPSHFTCDGFQELVKVQFVLQRRQTGGPASGVVFSSRAVTLSGQLSDRRFSLVELGVGRPGSPCQQQSNERGPTTFSFYLVAYPLLHLSFP